MNNVYSERRLLFIYLLLLLLLFFFCVSSLPHVANRQALWYSICFVVAKPNRKERFFLQFVRFSINVVYLFVFAGINLESPVLEPGTKIITVYLGSYRISDFS